MNSIQLILLLVCIGKLQGSLLDSAVFVVNSVYNKDQATSVVWWNTDMDHITQLIKAYKGVIVTVPMQFSINEDIRVIYKSTGFKQTVLLANSINDYKYFLETLNQYVIVPIKLIFVLLNPSIEISEITRISWENDVSDIVIISEDGNGNITLFTYFPYDPSSCGNYAPVTIDISGNIFSKKYYNFYGCPIKVTLFHFSPYVVLKEENGSITSIGGLDGDIFMILIEKLNASLDIVHYTSQGILGTFINGSGTGSFRDLVDRRADILVPAGLIDPGRFSAAQTSHVIETSDVYWCGPNRREIYAWAKILLHFFSRSAPYFCLTSIVFIVVTIIFKKIKQTKSVTKDSVLFQVFKIFLGQETRFETDSYLVNNLYVMWIWFCLVVRIVYQGDLVEGLNKNFLEPPLTTLEEAVEILDGFGGVEAFREYYRDTPLGSKYQVLRLHEMPVYINDISDGKRFLLAADLLVLHQAGRIVQILQDPVSRPPMCFFMRPGWTAAKEMDQLILRVIETGFVDKIFADFSHNWKKTTEAAKEKQNFRPLSINTLSACFYGLFACWAVCFVVLILEIVYYKLINLKSKLVIE